MTQPRRILILMSDTGGGHRSAAQAIASAFERNYPGRYHIEIVDAIVQTAIFPFNHIPSWYLPFVTYAEFLWAWSFRVLNRAIFKRMSFRFLNLMMGRKLKRLLRNASADLVISVHPLFNALPRRLLRSMHLATPFVTVVTDLFDAHTLWFDSGADLCLVPTEGARKTARKFGMPDAKLRVVGQPVSLKFLADGKGKTQHRAELGLANRSTILLVGGGEGMGKLFSIARALDAANVPAQLVIIAGRNQALREQLLAAPWQIPVNIQGFVTNMPDWMRASDLVITKAGPGTIMEALACDLPVLLSGFLPGQETGNVTFVESSGVGILCQEPSEIALVVRAWLTPGNATLAQLAARAHELARPRAALDIAKTLDAVVTAHLAQK